jgi:hypothetical protein
LKKLSCFIVTILFILSVISIQVNAAAELEFELKYDGDIVVNETKEGSVILRGTNASTYSNVRVKVDVEGPGTPKLIATDTNQQEFDLVDIKYWGPPEGFPVAGTFENETPIKATFPVAGTYTIKLTLVNMQASEAEIISKSFTVEVLEDATNVNEVNEPENEVEKLPQTGNSTMEYVMYIAIVAALVIFVSYKIKANK